MKHILIGISVLILNSTIDKDIDYGTCTPSNDSARMTVEFFLETTHLEDFRVETGTTDVKVSEIQHVDDPAVCQKLLDMVNANEDLQNDDSDTTMYFYKARDFYFIFYDFNIIKLGYTDFNVISSDFKVLGLYLI